MRSGETEARRKARELVEQIKKDHGHITEEIIEQIDESIRAVVSDALKVKDGMIGLTVITLAKNLYTSNARFVFEMLQNADDNEYSSTNGNPFISFHIYPHKIVVENNEDGFTPDNLGAICNVGKSTKKGAQGYIGEKGIGFKAVFMVAWKVLIQSGDFSFYFQHRKGDSGMGMISPVWQEPDHPLPDAFTRITLFLHDSGDAAFLAAQRQLISSQFHELQDTFLLFLKHIKNINIKFYDDNHKMTKEVIHTLESSARASEAKLTKRIIHFCNPDKTERSSRTFHISRHTATGLAKNENREYSAEEEAQRKYATSKIVLAFPLAPDSTPLVETQDVFAFLPLRTAGFSFLIQADFVTEANRQDLIPASARNLGLLDRIAQTFVNAVLDFCKHPTLTYQWMRYLPDPSNSAFQPFWKQLVTKIQSLLKSTAVLRPRSEGPLQLISSLRILCDGYTDRYGDPLWDDIDPPRYLSSRYASKDFMSLKPYGLQILFMDEIIARAKADLKSPNSRMKTSEDEDWQSRAAEMLTLPFARDWQDQRSELRAIELIPLRDGRWICANTGQLYYASSAGIQIPTDLGLNLIDPAAAQSTKRKTFFDHLGAIEVSSKHVRDKILDIYRNPQICELASLQRSRNHLEYLYLSQYHEDAGVNPAFGHVYLHTQERALYLPNYTNIYKPNNHDFGTRELLKQTPPGPNPGDGAPGHSVHFLHQLYFENVPPRPAGHPFTWTAFLNRYFNIKLRPRLICIPYGGSASLSEISHYLQRHRPELFLRVIQYYWKNQASNILQHRSIITELCQMEVLCKEGRKVPLSKTYLPTPSLERLQARYMADSEFFPFLKLPFPPKDDADSDAWQFLHKNFGTGRYDDLEFYLTILNSILDERKSVETLVNGPRVYGVYGQIQAKILSSEDQSRERCRVLELCEAKSAILIPGSRGRHPAWVQPSQCLWDGPQDMQTKYPVKSMCQAYFTASESGLSSLEQFFTDTLGLTDYSWLHLVDEVKYLKAASCTDFDRISGLYSLIDESIDIDDDGNIRLMRLEFDKHALIYVNVNARHKWCNISQCLWASATTIRGRTTLNDQYEDLKDFFVDVLGVSELSLDMMLDELIEKGNCQAPVAEIKETLWALASFVSSNTPVSSSRKLSDSRVLPVMYPNGQVVLQTSRAEFGIVDRQRLGDSFAGKAKLLDFSLEEVRLLKPFFAWTCLEHRYLSRMVKEITRADGGEPVPLTSRKRNVGSRAAALFRIARHYNSPRVLENDSSLHDVLKDARVYETDGISSLLVLSQVGREVTAQIERSELHISDASGLEIYVPRDPRSQDFCYLSKLPPRLFEWIMTNPDTQIREDIDPEAVLVVTRILNANVSSVNWILEEAGISEVAEEKDVDSEDSADDPDLADGGDDEELEASIGDDDEEVSNGDDDEEVSNGDDDDAADESNSGDDAQTRDGSTTTSSNDVLRSSEAILTPETTETAGSVLTSQAEAIPPTLTTSAQPSHTRAVSEVVYRHSHQGLAAASSSAIFRIETESPAPTHARVSSYAGLDQEIPSIGVDEDTRYIALLDNMINKASSMSIPTLGSFNMTQLLQSLSEADNVAIDYPLDHLRFRSATLRERDFKVGAAGELFVFELLSHLSPALPEFGRANWQSTIRKYVKVHPDYALMDDWTGRETADITYEDTSGVFTDLLIDEDYLDADRWRGQRPIYYIEVKSTTGPCGRPFFMSKHQYQLMQDLSVTARDSACPDGVYVVFRVFDLGMGAPGLRIYVDPEMLRQTGDLAFTAKTWSIVPGQVGR